jgi:hypothetical protein
MFGSGVGFVCFGSFSSFDSFAWSAGERIAAGERGAASGKSAAIERRWRRANLWCDGREHVSNLGLADWHGVTEPFCGGPWWWPMRFAVERGGEQ